MTPNRAAPDASSPPPAPRVLHVTTVPMSLMFLPAHVAHLRRAGFEVHVASSPGPLLEDFSTSHQVPAHGVPMARGINPGADLRSLVRLWRLIRRLRPAVVHTHTPKAGLLGSVAARLAGVPVVVFTVHGLPQMTRRGWSRRLLDFTTRLSCRAAQRVVCVSRSLRDWLNDERLCPAAKLVVCGSGSIAGVDALEVFNPERFDRAARGDVRAAYGIPAGAVVLGYVGRIVAEKGIGELAAAWRVLRQRCPRLHLLLVGPWEAHDPLAPSDEHLLRTDPRVHLAGMRRDVPPQLAAMDLFVNPTHREGFGLANLEAAAMGLPVVSTRIPGCVDSVEDGVTGTLVPARDSAALLAAVESYLTDPALRARHGRQGRQRVLRDFQPDAICAAVEREYRRLLAAAAPDRRRPAAALKRAVDVAVSSTGLVLLAPLLGLIALAIRVSMGAPVLFRQERPGLGGRPFCLLKFRTMTGAVDAQGRLRPDAERLTRLGRFLRATSLDELPELVNVLRGDMSLVGPRPLLVQYLDRYTPEQARRHDVRPGLTGWAQVHGRNELSWDERLALDVWYVDHRSLGLDLKILWLTVAAVLSRRGISACGHATMPEFHGPASNLSTPRGTAP